MSFRWVCTSLPIIDCWQCYDWMPGKKHPKECLALPGIWGDEGAILFMGSTDSAQQRQARHRSALIDITKAASCYHSHYNSKVSMTGNGFPVQHHDHRLSRTCGVWLAGSALFLNQGGHSDKEPESSDVAKEPHKKGTVRTVPPVSRALTS